MGDNLASSSQPTQDENKELKIQIPQDLETSLRDEFCIYKVPPTLRHINPSAYIPQVISIGPIHHGKMELQDMETQKLRYFKEFCKRTGNQVDYLEKILRDQINEEEIRHCYAYNSGHISSNKFVQMILLDSVFILELFLRDHEAKQHGKDYIIGKPWLRADVQQDLILLENQLPFSILEKLYNFAKQRFNQKGYPSFLDLTGHYFTKFKPKEPVIQNLQLQNILHFTDLIRRFWTYEHPKILPGSSSIGSLYSITKLHQAGLKLTAARDKCLLDIEFKSGMTSLTRSELKLPIFEVDDTTEFVVRNLMALEQCHYPYETYICSYIRMLDFLIDTAEDVDLLVGKKIIVNGLGDSAAVATMVNKLCNQIAEVESCYYFMAVGLNKYYENCCNHAIATLRSVYFGDLWRGTGTVAAAVLVALTFIQTVCSFLQLNQSSP